MLPRYNGVFISSILNDAFFYAEFQFSYFLPSPPPLLPLFLSLQLRKPKIARRRARLTFHFFSRSLSLSFSFSLSLSSSIYFLSKLLEDGPGQGEKGWPVGWEGGRDELSAKGVGVVDGRESGNEREREERKRDDQSLKTSAPTCWDALIINSISYRHALTFFGPRWRKKQETGLERDSETDRPLIARSLSNSSPHVFTS